MQPTLLEYAVHKLQAWKEEKGDALKNSINSLFIGQLHTKSKQKHKTNNKTNKQKKKEAYTTAASLRIYWQILTSAFTLSNSLNTLSVLGEYLHLIQLSKNAMKCAQLGFILLLLLLFFFNLLIQFSVHSHVFTCEAFIREHWHRSIQDDGSHLLILSQ